MAFLSIFVAALGFLGVVAAVLALAAVRVSAMWDEALEESDDY